MSVCNGGASVDVSLCHYIMIMYKRMISAKYILLTVVLLWPMSHTKETVTRCFESKNASLKRFNLISANGL